ncbi:TPA: hypothetical protein ACH3X2_006479 [Trebouxia sp. C0005]
MLRAHMQRSLRLQSPMAAWVQPAVNLLQQSHCMRIYEDGTEQSWRSAITRCTCSQAYSSGAMAGVCWQCGNELKEGSLFFCSHCKSILPPAAQPDLFKVMGLTEPTYDIDKGQLEARYKRLQKDLHPDKFGGRDAQQQEYSAEQSSLVNHAYVKLKSPLQRALYLLERKGKPAPEDGGTISDPVLLMEVMEQRELVEETNDVGILQVMLQENKLLEQATTEAGS